MLDLDMEPQASSVQLHKEPPTEKIKIESNKVLLQLPNEKEKKYIIYVPSYMRIELENFKEMSMDSLNAVLKVHVKFDIDITNLPESIVKLIK